MTCNGRYYVGSTNNIQRRLDQYQKGKCLATKHVRPVTLLYHKQYDCLSVARSIEKHIKKQKSIFVIQKFMDS